MRRSSLLDSDSRITPHVPVRGAPPRCCHRCGQARLAEHNIQEDGTRVVTCLDCGELGQRLASGAAVEVPGMSLAARAIVGRNWRSGMRITPSCKIMPADCEDSGTWRALIGGKRGDAAAEACNHNGRRIVDGRTYWIRAWVATMDDRLAGVCWGIETMTEFTIDDLWVCKDARRQGVASALLMHAAIEAEREQLPLIACCRTSDRVGLHFLRRWGFRRAVDGHGHDVLWDRNGQQHFVLTADPRVRIEG